MKKMLNIIVVLIIFALFFMFCRRINDNAMFPTLKKGDWILFWPFQSEIQQGDLLLLYDPLDTDTLLIRRVVATDLDQIMIDLNHTTHINGKSLEQKELDHDDIYRYIQEISHEGTEEKHWRLSLTMNVIPKQKIISTIPKEHFFVLADNRHEHFDSRFWGAISKENVLGKIWFRVGKEDLWQNSIVFF